MSKHTPGPWEFIVENVGGGWKYATQNVCIFSGETYIADYETSGCEFSSNDENEANARLIAAAPDLLDACKTFAEWLRREDEGYVKSGKTRDTPEGEAAWREWFYENIRICNEAQELARAAIAKATGESA